MTAPVANRLLDGVGVLETFEILGVAYFILVVGSSLFLVNPPGEYRTAATVSGRNYTLGEALRTWQWYALWALLFLNVTAGISIISQAAPMAQEITGVTAAAAAGMVGIISIANGAGRFFWAWLSDFAGRRQVFATMFLLQGLIFFELPRVNAFGVFTTLALIILLCYGGGFGTMPAFCADYFGARDVGSIYGLMLTAWGFGSALGPLLIAHIREASGHYSQALYAIAAVMLVSSAIPFAVHPPSQPIKK